MTNARALVRSPVRSPIRDTLPSTSGETSQPPLFDALEGYWDFTDSANMTLTGSLVDQVNDLSGNGNHATQTGAERPEYKSDLGGRVSYAGAQSLLVPVSFSLDRRDCTIFVVQRVGSHNAFRPSFQLTQTSAALIIYQTNGGVCSLFDGSARTTSMRYGDGIETHWARCGATDMTQGIGRLTTSLGSALNSGSQTGAAFGRWQSGVFDYLGDHYCILAYSRELTQTETNQVNDWLEAQFATASRSGTTSLCFDGDSITNGGAGVSSEFDWNYPLQLSRLSSPNIRHINDGADGDQVQSNTNPTAVKTWLTADANYTNRIVIGLWGSNDINNSRTEAQVEADIDSWIASIQAHDAGAILVGLTILPRTDFSAGEELIRVAVNNHILNTASFDHTVDVANATNLTDATNTTYYSDGVHPTDAGAAILASEVHDLLVAQGYV